MGVLRAKVAGNWIDIGGSAFGGNLPVGAICSHGAATAPAGFLVCDGAAVLRSTYAELFAVIGTTWGAGDGSTTFNVPDLRGRTAIGSGTGTGLTARALAAQVGEEAHLLQGSESGTSSHLHSVDPPATDVILAGTMGGSIKRIISDYGAGSGSAATPNVTPNIVTSGNAYVDILPFNSALSVMANATNPHNNMQPSAVVTYIICAMTVPASPAYGPQKFATVTIRDATWPAATVGDGAVCIVTANDITGGMYEVHGGAWRRPWGTAWGHVAYFDNQTAVNNITAVTDIATATFTMVAGRRYKFTGQARFFLATDNTIVEPYITNAGNVVLSQVTNNARASWHSIILSAFNIAGVAGSYTAKLRVATAGNTINTAPGTGIPISIAVEDVGPY
jgi:microcystin-dependent protein